MVEFERLKANKVMPSQVSIPISTANTENHISMTHGPQSTQELNQQGSRDMTATHECPCTREDPLPLGIIL